MLLSVTLPPTIIHYATSIPKMPNIQSCNSIIQIFFNPNQSRLHIREPTIQLPISIASLPTTIHRQRENPILPVLSDYLENGKLESAHYQYAEPINMPLSYYHIIYQAKRGDRNFTTSINIPKNYPGIDQLLYIFKQQENQYFNFIFEIFRKKKRLIVQSFSFSHPLTVFLI